MRIELVQTRDLERFRGVVQALGPELGERFPKSIENWCGIGTRPYPLPVWEVFLPTIESEPVGVCGYYQQLEDPPTRFWIGWFGVMPELRGTSIGSQLLAAMEHEIRSRGGHSVAVYAASERAVRFYEENGYARAGVIGDARVQQAAAKGDEILLMKSLEDT